jgi:hypothetical protein
MNGPLTVPIFNGAMEEDVALALTQFVGDEFLLGGTHPRTLASAL